MFWNKKKGPQHPLTVDPGVNPLAEEPEAALERGMREGLGYQAKYGQSLVVQLGLVATLALSVLLNIIQFSTRPHPPAYAVTPDMRFIRLTPLGEESVDPGAIRQWAAKTVINCYTLDFRHITEQLNDMEPEFTDAGYEGWLASIDSTGLKKQIQQYNYVVSAIVPEVPSITLNKVLNGVRVYKITVPVTVTFQSGASATSQNMLVTLVAVRVPETRNGVGIAVQSFVAARRV